MKILKVTKENEQYYSLDFIRGYNLGTKQQAEIMPERKKCKWISKHLPASIGSKVFVDVNICSNCGYVVEGNNVSNFCPVCGSDMRGDRE